MDDLQVRLETFRWLQEQTELRGEVLPRTLLQQGFELDGVRIPLVSPQGIFTPAVLELPLTITTVWGGPYKDSFDRDGLLSYKYRGTDPQHRDNVGLRRLMSLQRPLIYFHGITPGRYLAAWPVYVVGDRPETLTFTVALDDRRLPEPIGEVSQPEEIADSGDLGRRVYITSTFRRRLHQEAFRERVLRAYREQCALCRLRHVELLDAAHIVPDADPLGEPVVANGLALCKLHHAAFDRHFLAVNPDYRVEVRADILEEEDGPMLEHGLQGLHLTRIHCPSAANLRPGREFLERRYALFQQAAARL
jgi:putative restriction endonuclease